MTVIEIRPHRWGWTVFEAPGVEKKSPISGTWFRRFRRRINEGRFTVLLGLRDRLPNYTRPIQIRFWRY